MRIALIADTHLPRGTRRLPARCVEVMRDADLILHAGDVSTAGALADMRALRTPLLAVRGNVDDAELRATLPEQVEVDADGAWLAMVHDAGPARGRLARLRRRFPDADAVIFGHSHIPLHERAGAFQIFNPGSPTERRRAPHRTIGIAHVDAGRIEFEHVTLE